MEVQAPKDHVSGMQSWGDVLGDARLVTLTEILSDREATYALLDRIGTFPDDTQDVEKFLILLGHLARHARWVGGKITVVLMPGLRIGRIRLMLMNGDGVMGIGSARELLKKADVPGFLTLIREQLERSPELILPFMATPGPDQQIELSAPKLESLIPESLRAALGGSIPHDKLAPPRVPRDIAGPQKPAVAPPPRTAMAPKPVARVALVQQRRPPPLPARALSKPPPSSPPPEPSYLEPPTIPQPFKAAKPTPLPVDKAPPMPKDDSPPPSDEDFDEKWG